MRSKQSQAAPRKSTSESPARVGGFDDDEDDDQRSPRCDVRLEKELTTILCGVKCVKEGKNADHMHDDEKEEGTHLDDTFKVV